MTLLDPNAGAGPSGLPPMTLEQAADYINRLAMIEAKFLEVVNNDPVTWAANSTKAAIVLFEHCRQLEELVDELQILVASGGQLLRTILEDPGIGEQARVLLDLDPSEAAHAPTDQ